MCEAPCGTGAPMVAAAESVPILTPVRASVPATADRKSTRLNSSHLVISYAVFCLKNKQRPQPLEQPLDAGPVELRGGLVEDDEPGAERQRPRDFQGLPLLDGQPAGLGLRIDVDLPGVQQLRRVLPQRPPGDDGVLPVEVEVLRDREAL